MKVWIIMFETGYDTDSIVDILSTEDKAKSRMKEFDKDSKRSMYIMDWDVE